MMSSASRALSRARIFLWVAVVALAAAASFWRPRGEAPSSEHVAVFSPTQRGCAIVVPVDAIPAERRAAELLRATLAKASGRPASAFSILVEREELPAPAVFVGAAARAGDFLRAENQPPFDTAVGIKVEKGAVFLRSERRESVMSAASWFLERHLGAYWFMPGSLGEHVPPRREVVLPPGETIVRPGFLHRDLSTRGSPAGDNWYARNRLETRFEHHHNLATIFRAEDFRRLPEMAPMRRGQRYMPAHPGDYAWQPNLISTAAVRHAADVARRAFDADPTRLSYSLSTNDSMGYDDSAATLAVVSPPRYFRRRPDYSDLVFGFTNAVAELVRETHPDRWLPAYAYYWCENTPRFPVARNVVPFLTADSSQWFEPEFAAEDRALIERWCNSGAGIVGAYDYLEGTPFLVPRTMLYAIKESIPFKHRVGVRAYYGEGEPNWGLDGPKLWLAAQLLWAPERNPDELLELYYREFWAEAAAPMREFFAECDRALLEQPRPGVWLKYYTDEDQVLLFPAERRTRLRHLIEEARRLAAQPTTRARIDFVSTGFGIAEAFAEFCAARERLGRRVRDPKLPARQALEGWQEYLRAREAFTEGYARVRQVQPLALAPQKLDIYLRNEPDSRVARLLSQGNDASVAADELRVFTSRTLDATPGEIARLFTSGVECLKDPQWQSVSVQGIGSSATLVWTPPGKPWQGRGEPWERRSIEKVNGRDGVPLLRFVDCRTEDIGQWMPAAPNALYGARVRVRAKVSPNHAPFLIVNFLDEKQQHVGLGRIDRLPASEEVQEIELCVIVRAPSNARSVGFAVRVLNQSPGDFAEFSRPSLRRLAE